jgi:membrane protease YdiL (CAAX protease family)
VALSYNPLLIKDTRRMNKGVHLLVRAVWSGLVGLIISLSAAVIWTALIVANIRSNSRIPWSVPVMALVLWAMWRYWGGAGWPRSTSELRRSYRRANPVSWTQVMWSLTAGVLGIIALAGYWIVFFNLFRMRPNSIPDLSAYPALMVYPMLVMGSLVSPLSEETGFRGYSQLMLQRSSVRPAAAVVISSIFFALGHLNHGLLWPKLLVYFLVGVTFGVIATLTNSILASIPVHIAGDLVFFLFVWPHDAARRLIWDGGPDGWFWFHVVQAVAFTGLALLAFSRLATLSRAEPHPHTDAAAGSAVA